MINVPTYLSAIRLTRFHHATRALTLCGLLGLLSACGGKNLSPGGPPQVEGCDFQTTSQFLAGYVLVCDQLHDLDAARPFAQIFELQIKETADVEHVDLSGFHKLVNLTITNGNIKTLNLSGNTALQDIELNMQGLTHLELPAIQIHTMSLINLPALTELDSSLTQFQILSLSGDLGFDVNSLLSHTEIWSLQLSRINLEGLDLVQMENLKYLQLSDCEYQDLQLPIKKDLELTISGGGTSELDISSTQLAGITLISSQIQTLKVPDLDFVSIKLQSHKATSLSVIDGEAISSLQIIGGDIQSIETESLPALQHLTLYQANIERLNLQANEGLVMLSVRNTPTREIVLPDSASITEIDLQNIQLTELHIPGYSTLETLFIMDAPITLLTTGTLPNLHNVYLEKTSLNDLPLESLPNLSKLDILDHQLTQLNLSSNPKLQSLYLSNVSGFTELDLSHLNLNGLWIVESDLSCNSLQTIQAQNSGLGEEEFYLSDLTGC